MIHKLLHFTMQSCQRKRLKPIIIPKRSKRHFLSNVFMCSPGSYAVGHPYMWDISSKKSKTEHISLTFYHPKQCRLSKSWSVVHQINQPDRRQTLLFLRYEYRVETHAPNNAYLSTVTVLTGNRIKCIWRCTLGLTHFRVFQWGKEEEKNIRKKLRLGN